MPGLHAKLSASASARWIACPGSVRLTAGLSETTSRYAAEGTAAHQLAEMCLREGRDAAEYIDRTFTVGEFDFEVDEDMAEAVQVYVELVRLYQEDGYTIKLESRLDALQQLHPDMGGTTDASGYDAAKQRLVVIDYKHGKGKAVEVKDNTQELIYVIGNVLGEYADKPIGEIELVVVQPRKPHPDGPVRRCALTPADLLDWMADLRAAALRTEDPDAPLIPGSHCDDTFCGAAGFCPALKDRALALAQAEFSERGEAILPEPTRYSAEELGALLPQIALIENWCQRVIEFAHHEAEAGRMPAGHKLVAGRASRMWRSEEDARAAIPMLFGVDEPDLFVAKEPKFRSPAQMESLLGLKTKKQKAEIEHLWQSLSSKTVLAPIDDPRPAVANQAASEFQPREIAG